MKIKPGQSIIFRLIGQKIKFKIVDSLALTNTEVSDAILFCQSDKTLYSIQWDEFWSEVLYDRLATKFVIH